MKHVFGAVAASCFVAVAILFLSWTTYFAQLNSNAYDFTLRLSGPIAPTSPTLIVAIDEDSLARIGAWPWSRDKLAQLLDSIERGSPKAVALDILLDDKKSDENDQTLAKAISNAPGIVLAARLDSMNGLEHWRQPDQQFVQPHVHLGHVHADPDFDGISRRIISPKIGEARAIPAFGIETLRVAGLSPRTRTENGVHAATIIRPETVNIRFAGDNKSFRHLPAWKVLDGSIPPSEFKDQMVLIGATFEGLGDEWFTPFAEAGQKMSGVEIHANVIETLYAGRAVRETPDLIVLACLFAMILLTWRLDRRFEGRGFYSSVILAAPGALVLTASWLLMKYFNVWLPFPSFLAALIVVVPGLGVRKIVRVNRDLDGKIERLSIASVYQSGKGSQQRPAVQPAAWKRPLAGLTPGPDRDGWLSALQAHERETAELDQARQQLFGSRRHNSRWKLHAVDFFSEELMRFLSFNNAILASIEDVIIVSDPAGRVVYQNPAARRLSPYTEEPGFALDYMSSLLDGRKLVAEFAGVLTRREPVVMEFVPSPRERKFYNLTLSPISHSGVVLTLHDVTAQYELNQAKNDMVSLVSHELRTPLTSIRGYSDMLLKYNLVQEKGKEFLATIIEESGRLNQLIQSFLDIAYIESGRQKITKTRFEIGPVLKDMLSMIEPLAAQKEIRIAVMGEAEGTVVRADRLLFYQAVSNLVTNAIKYSSAGTAVKIGVVSRDGQVAVQVTDEGAGIPADEQGKIFEKFYRRGNKETRGQSGFGLGLAFVKEVATRHRGDVTVESEVGRGSVFTLWVPR
jgi:signal transduction histidine kinase/CHASE2 domain-containing sensor protein